MQGSTSYGVSYEGISGVYKKIHTELIDNASEALNNNSALIEAISAGWAGDDCKIFLENLVSLKDKIIVQLDAYDVAIADEFYLLQQKWQQFQESNVKKTG